MAILLAVGVFTLGVTVASARSTFGHPSASRGAEPTAWSGPSRRIIVRLVYMGVICNLAAAIFALRSHGFGIGQVLSVEGLLSTGNTVTIARYSGERGSQLVSPLLAVGYAAALVSPFLRRGSVNWPLVLAPACSSLAYAAVTTQRLGLLISVAFTAGGLIASNVLSDGQVPRMSRRAIAGVLVSAMALAVAFTGVAFIRVGRVDATTAETIFRKQQVYALGSLPAFSQWLRRVDGPESGDAGLGWGTASVAGVEYITGQSRLAARAYDEFEVIDSRGASSNVYTIFRGIILDFGWAGGVLVIGLLGFAFGRVYRRVQWDRSAAWAGILGSGYATILLSNTMAVTSFSNVVLAMVIGVAALGWPTIRDRDARTHVAPRANPAERMVSKRRPRYSL
jgi:oligosaccharide repeat unit polymerase